MLLRSLLLPAASALPLASVALGAPVAAPPVPAAPAQDGDASDDGARDDEVELDATPAALLRCVADAAAEMPLTPHVKTRSRLQAEIVEAALAAGEVDLARALVDEIENWRKGLAQALIAAHVAEHGEAEVARADLDRAHEIEATITGEREQGWRRDRVRAYIARAHALLGDLEEAREIQLRLDPVEAARLAPLSVRFADAEDVPRQLEVLTSIAETSQLAQIQAALESMGGLYGRFAETAEDRSEYLDRVRSLWKKLPIQPRIEVLEVFIGHDVADGELEHARALVDEVESMTRGHRWMLEDRVRLYAGAARLRNAVGQPERARALVAEAIDAYVEGREEIVSIFRGRALRPLAETYLALGDAAGADNAYQRALAEAVINPNSRPRLDDLVSAVNSMVAAGHEPSVALRAQILAVAGSLGDPW